VEASLCRLGFRNQRCEEDDGGSLHSGIGLDLCGYVASVSLWHHDVEQDEVGPEIPRTLMRLGGVVLFEYTVPAYLLEKDFDQVGAVPLVINNQDASLIFHRRPRKSFVRRHSCGGVSSLNNPGKNSLGRKVMAWMVPA
jgi:hypothetical protein